MNFDEKLLNWKNKLLDMGKRNNLLNFKFSRKTTLQILKPNVYDLWETFVIKEKPLVFPLDKSELLSSEESLPNEVEDVEVLENNSKGSNAAIITNKTQKEQQRTLRSLRDKAKTITEEQGVNVLYLSFGFLHWNESKDSNVYFDAPIILVPVTLVWESITSPFKLTINEDDITVNPTLLYKLENDYGITLPEFNVDNGLSDYLFEVKNIIKNNGWGVLETTGLGLLSFLKLNMYSDLEKLKDRIVENKIIRAIAGDSSALDKDVSGITTMDASEFDNTIKPENTFQVVDADSSQQEAIYCAQKGVSFVLQGPPGTGKSQTITNIIAECLADGKKVLFVSEKMAALQVVFKRLQDTGLEDFILLMHNHKANKKAIMDQFANVLSLSRQNIKVKDELYQKLRDLYERRNALNEYANAIYKVIAPLNKTVYEVNGYLAKLGNYPDVTFAFDGIRCISNGDLSRYVNLLKKYVSTLRKMDGSLSDNPWYGSNIAKLTHGLRQDINIYLQRLSVKNQAIIDLYERLETGLDLKVSGKVSDITKIKEILEIASLGENVPIGWIVGNDIAPFDEEIRQCSKTKERFIDVRNNIWEAQSRLAEKDKSVGFVSNDVLSTTEQIDRYIKEIDEVIANNDVYSRLNVVSDIDFIDKTYQDLKSNLNEVRNIRASILNEYEKEIFDIDYNSMYLRFKTEYTSFFKMFKSNYRSDKKLFKGYHRNRAVELNDDGIFNVLCELRRLEEANLVITENQDIFKKCFGDYYKGLDTDVDLLLEKIEAYKTINVCAALANDLRKVVLVHEEQETVLKEHYETLYSGIETDWDFVRKYLEWANKFKDVLAIIPENIEFIRRVCTSADSRKLCREYGIVLGQKNAEFEIDYNWFSSLFDCSSLFAEVELFELSKRLDRCMNGLEMLEDWIDYSSIRNECRDGGLKNYLDALDGYDIKSDDIIGAFKKRFYRLWLDAVIDESKVIANFRRKNQDSTIEEFKALDKQQFKIARIRIKEKLVNDLPALDSFTSGVDEISILKRELNKSKRIMPIRKLFAKIPNLILMLKPCLMMSPLSVSLFLEAESFKFDTVIFDEASQVCTENAIGAILRGQQVIIAGDSKQLPPTNFFNASTSGIDFDGDEENDDGDAYESVLDEAALLPEKTLLWHYRSRHEHLIAFSNAKIYKNQLITFPSNIEKAPDNGVEYVYVATGRYDRGGKRGNVEEAQKVAEMVFEHFEKYRTGGVRRSLGVIAFGEIQQMAIDTALRKMRMSNPEYEQFFSEELDEPFFVKNLENVQGDERDTIIFSIGYAKNNNGVMYMNFGPLSKAGGERRLNVAITRAKYNVKLVGSILPTDIDVDKVSSEGPKLLRSYIDFAMRGPIALDSAIEESDVVQFDSPFEEAVYNYLDRRGYRLATQVGCSGYRIDMAVKHPTISGCYVLGIECDGAAYHSARTARERDRLRQDVLENMGWKIYRIWSTDWIKDPVSEGQKLINVIDEAIKQFSSNELYEDTVVENIPLEDFVEVTDKEAVDADNVYDFEEFMEFELPDRWDNFSEVKKLETCLKFHIYNNSPIHYDLLCQKCCFILNRNKVTSVVRNSVDEVLRYDLDGYYDVDKNFYSPKRLGKVHVRKAGTRSIKYISIDELGAGMLMVAAKRVGITKDSLLDETMRAFGFARRTSNINEALEEAYGKVLNEGKINEVDGKVSI